MKFKLDWSSRKNNLSNAEQRLQRRKAERRKQFQVCSKLIMPDWVTVGGDELKVSGCKSVFLSVLSLRAISG